jgi:hypothetical protein
MIRLGRRCGRRFRRRQHFQTTGLLFPTTGDMRRHCDVQYIDEARPSSIFGRRRFRGRTCIKRSSHQLHRLPRSVRTHTQPRSQGIEHRGMENITVFLGDQLVRMDLDIKHPPGLDRCILRRFGSTTTHPSFMGGSIRYPYIVFRSLRQESKVVTKQRRRVPCLPQWSRRKERRGDSFSRLDWIPGKEDAEK